MLKDADKIRSSDPERSRSLLDEVKKAQLTKAQTDLYNYLIAYNYFTIGEQQKAQKHIEQNFKENPLSNSGLRANNTLLTIYISTGNWAKAIPKAQFIKESINNDTIFNTKTLEETKLSILVFYNHIGEYDLAKQLADSLLTTAESTRVKCMARSERLYSYVKTSPNSVKPTDFFQTRELCKKIDELILENVVNAFLAKYYLTVNQPNQAISVLTANIMNVKTTNYQALIAGFYELMADAYLAMEDFANAEQHAQILIETEDQHQYKQAITTAYKVLAGVSEHRKDYAQALNYYKQYSEAKQLNLDQENAKLLALQKAQFDDVEKSVQIVLLDKENALLKTQALLDSADSQNKRLALALLSLALAVFILWTYKNRRNYLRLQHYAQTDELTGIANRHYFTQQAKTAIKYCKRTDQPASLIIFDLDFFKRINDTYGHQTGDIALKVAVEAAKTGCRKNDIVGRLGGEEFGILLPGCASHLASFIAEKCRKSIEQADYTSSGHALDVTASFGIADSSNCEYDFEKLFAGADFALYQSKDMGRNRVAQYQQEAVTFAI
jgi:diguanylate cyclase (GGDEF)-like protein